MLRFAALFTAIVISLSGQTAARILGSVTAIAGDTLTVKTDAGEEVQVNVSASVKVQRVAPGERDLTKAETITWSDVATGDRILVRGARSGSAVTADSLIIMTARAIAQKQTGEREAWQKRGAFGAVDSVDEKQAQIRLTVRTGVELQPVIVAVNEHTVIRRYTPDSIRFSDAVPSRLSEIRKGDQLRVLGDKDVSGNRISAERLVFGTFRTLAGTVTSASPAEHSVTLKEFQTGKTITVRTRPDSQLKRLAGMRLGMGMRGGPGGGPGGGPPDLGTMLERMPASTLEEMKAGDTVIVSSTAGAKPDQVTAIVLVAGAEPIINMLTARAESRRGQDALAGGPSTLSQGLDGMMGGMSVGP